jgi:hypothetical protein
MASSHHIGPKLLAAHAGRAAHQQAGPNTAQGQEAHALTRFSKKGPALLDKQATE